MFEYTIKSPFKINEIGIIKSQVPFHVNEIIMYKKDVYEISGITHQIEIMSVLDPNNQIITSVIHVNKLN